MSLGAPNEAPRRLNSNDVHIIEKFKNGEFESYSLAQRALTKVAPRNGVGFVALRQEPRRIVYRDITPSFGLLGAFETQAFVTFLRGRRWGKSVMLDAWVTFMRRRKSESSGATSSTAAAQAQAASDPFEGTWAHDKFPHTTCIGVKLDMSAKNTFFSCVCHIVDGFNEGLRLAGIARRVPLPTVGSTVSRVDAEDAVGVALRELGNVATEHNMPVALAIDEYDYMFTHCLGEHPRVRIPPDEVLNFLGSFYAALKATAFITNAAITGSSRLAVRGLFSGANNFVDISLERDAALVLGYTWREVQALFAPQLELLKVKHQLTDDELKSKVAEWYNGHRWTPAHQGQLFNPFSVNALMEKGEFAAHWAETGGTSLVFKTHLVVQELVAAALNKDAPLSIAFASMKLPAPTPVGQTTWTREQQLALLASTGMLAVHPKDTVCGEPAEVNLCVPNMDARASLVDLLAAAWNPKSVPLETLERYVLAGDLVGLFHDTSISDSVADLTGRLASPSESHGTLVTQEFHVCTAISVVLLHSMKQRTAARFKFIPELRCRKFDVSTPDTLAAPTPLKDQGSGRSWTGDLFFLVPADPNTDGTARMGYMVEVKVLRPADLLSPAQPSKGAAKAATQKQRQKPRKGVLRAALQQVLKYQLIDHDIGVVDLRFAVLLFDQQGRLVDGTNAMTKPEALERLKKEGGFKKPKEKNVNTI